MSLHRDLAIAATAVVIVLAPLAVAGLGVPDALYGLGMIAVPLYGVAIVVRILDRPKRRRYRG